MTEGTETCTVLSSDCEPRFLRSQPFFFPYISFQAYTPAPIETWDRSDFSKPGGVECVSAI